MPITGNKLLGTQVAGGGRYGPKEHAGLDGSWPFSDVINQGRSRIVLIARDRPFNTLARQSQGLERERKLKKPNPHPTKTLCIPKPFPFPLTYQRLASSRAHDVGEYIRLCVCV